MNRLATTLLICLLGAATLSARAQNHRYAIVEYMHLPEGKGEEAYLATEKLWQRLHQRAVDAGMNAVVKIDWPPAAAKPEEDR
jgi:phosphoribosyl-dephospho-CoA transferase